MAQLGEKVRKVEDEIKTERQAKWQRIQDEAPEIAAFLVDVNDVFGKPVRTWVEINGERIL
jgi:hypothetical protein